MNGESSRRERRRATRADIYEAKRLVKEGKRGVSKKGGPRRVLNLESFDLVLTIDERAVPISTAVDIAFERSPCAAAEQLAAEDEYGNTEYKLKLIDWSEERLDHLATQMHFRLEEGRGEALYRVGFADDGAPVGLAAEDLRHSLAALAYIAQRLKVVAAVVDVRTVNALRVVDVRVRRPLRERMSAEVRVMLFGAPGAGKSTLVGLKARRSARRLGRRPRAGAATRAR